MGKIMVMSDSLANKIAAGEVVERPASVVKELVENAIDAGSKRIEIEVEDGGLTLIRVADDGEGMDAEDLEKAFLRHATSKMRSERDLFRITTLGFRGEALPSIAAVSKVEVATRSRDQLLAHTISLEGNKVIRTSQTPHPFGTEIWVRDLFFNTPARLKYLKSVQTENHHIQDIVNRLALAHPDISIRLINDGKEILKTAGTGDLLTVIHTIYGLEIAKKMIPIQGEHLDFHIDGFIGKPEITRGSRAYISFLVNGRFVRSNLLQRAILDGYHTLLPVNRYPFAVIQLRMDPTLVDVNVHPSKLEVRFSKEEELAKWMKEQVKRRLLYSSLIPESNLTDRRKRQHSEQDRFDLHWKVNESLPFNAFAEPPDSPSINTETSVRLEEKKVEEDVTENYSHQNMEEIDCLNARKVAPLLEPLAQLHGTYILAQNEEGLYIIDQHAAQERINYERFRQLLGSPSKDRQILAIAYTYELTSSEAEIIRNSDSLLREIGIIQEPFGDRSFLVREIPNWFIKGKEEAQIDEIIQLILQGKGRFTLADIRDKSAQLMACKASIKANQHLSREEMRSLLHQLSLVENPYTCPHGRPVLVHFSLYEIEKLFKRVM